MKKSSKFSLEVRERAVKMVHEHRGECPSLWTTIEAPRIKELERQVKELRQANEILKLASTLFAQAELDPCLKS